MYALRMGMCVMDRWKPCIKKVVPLALLRKVRRSYMKLRADRLRKEQIEPFGPRRYEDGINLVGNSRGDFGLGQSCRLVAWELGYSKVPFGIYEYHSSENCPMNDHSCDGMQITKPKYNINLFHINANEFTEAYYRLGKKLWDYHYNIAFWLWELEEFPEDWTGCIHIVDEIWTPSEFVSKAIRKKTEKPVVTVPYHVEAPTDARYGREHFALPKDQFLFLVMYDSNSMIERKNPMGALKAFKRAFPKEDHKVGLVIKLNGRNQKEMSWLRQYLEGYENVYFMSDIMSKMEVNSLIAVADAYVSMHRAEGFGLIMAEAMQNGVPCIATNWSANTEFMNPDIACMVDYKLVPIKKDIGPFRKGNHWAEPDVRQAAGYMKKLCHDREFCRKLSEKAKRHMEEALGMETISKKIKNRLREIYATTARG